VLDHNYTSDGTYSQATGIGEPLTITNPLGNVTHYRYDPRGNRTVVVDALGNETDTSYNLANQELATTLPATGQTGTGHGLSTNTYLYVGGPMTVTTIVDESGNQSRQVSTTYGPEGEALSEGGSTEPVTRAYDALYRLRDLADGNGNTTQYSYNAAGYLATVVYPGATGLTGADTINYPSYDALGNALQRVDGNGVTTTFAYTDPDNKLTAITYPASTSLNVALAYDGFGRRASMTDATGSKTYSYDDNDTSLAETTTYTGLAAQTIGYSYFADGSRSAVSTPAGQAALVTDVYQKWVVGASPRQAQEAAVLFANAANPGDSQVQVILRHLPQSRPLT